MALIRRHAAAAARRRRGARIGPLLCALALVCAALIPARDAAACSIDGVASLSMNGNIAVRTGGAPTAATMRHWAPFTLLAAAPGDRLRLQENRDALRGVLPASAFGRPFRWSWGDGAAGEGAAPAHRYARTGWYRISVSYYWPARARWVAFDSAQIHIVPAGELLTANLGFYIGKWFLLAMRLVIWATLALVALLIVLRLRRRARA